MIWLYNDKSNNKDLRKSGDSEKQLRMQPLQQKEQKDMLQRAPQAQHLVTIEGTTIGLPNAYSARTSAEDKIVFSASVKAAAWLRSVPGIANLYLSTIEG